MPLFHIVLSVSVHLEYLKLNDCSLYCFSFLVLMKQLVKMSSSSTVSVPLIPTEGELSQNSNFHYRINKGSSIVCSIDEYQYYCGAGI